MQTSRSDCEYVQTELWFRWARMSEDTFSQVVAHMNRKRATFQVPLYQSQQRLSLRTIKLNSTSLLRIMFSMFDTLFSKKKKKKKKNVIMNL